MTRAWPLLSLLCVSCITEHHIAVEIQPQDVDGMGAPIYPAGAVVFELAIYPGKGCPVDRDDDADLCADERTAVETFLAAPPGTPAHRQSFGLDEPGASIGELDVGDYTWAAALRRADCATVAFGCSNAPVGSASQTAVAIPLCTLTSPIAGCPAGTTCSAGECAR